MLRGGGGDGGEGRCGGETGWWIERDSEAIGGSGRELDNINTQG